MSQRLTRINSVRKALQENPKFIIRKELDYLPYEFKVTYKGANNDYKLTIDVSNKYVGISIDKGKQYEPHFCFFETMESFYTYITSIIENDLAIKFEGAIDYDDIVSEFNFIKKKCCYISQNDIVADIHNNLGLIKNAVKRIEKELYKGGKQ